MPDTSIQTTSEIGSYHIMYLQDAQQTFGELFDCLVNTVGFDPDKFWDLFVKSGVSYLIEDGDPAYHAKSNFELVLEVQRRMKIDDIVTYGNTYFFNDSTPEYWAGWILAFYQWYTNQTFEEIHKYIKFQDIVGMYIFHEASEMKTVDAINERRDAYFAK